MNYVGTIIQKLANMSVSDNKALSLKCKMRIEHEGIRLNLSSIDEKLILSFGSIKDFFSFMRLKNKNRQQINSIVHLSDNLLSTLGLNLYLFNSYLCIIGPKAGYLVPKLLGIR